MENGWMTSSMKAHVPDGAVGQAAFTLVELLVVIGLMAMLGTISVTGYFAAVRGMSDRAALDDTRSLIRLAMQTCLIDQTPTAVLFYNRQNQVETTSVSAEEVKATSSGSAIAIKMAGRISYKDGDVLVDEFADWNQSYPVKKPGSTSEGSIRFYKMTDLDKVAKGIDSCSSLMYDYVQEVYGKFENELMISSRDPRDNAFGIQVQAFCEQYKKDRKSNEEFSGTSYDNGNSYRFGRRIRQDNGISWKVGDAYGVEIATLDLPRGYIFGDQEPSSMKIKSVPSLSFSPGDATAGDNKYWLDLDNSVKISAWRSERFKSIGSLTASDLRDEVK